MSEEKLELAEVHTAEDFMASIRENMQACMQCGTCTGSCHGLHPQAIVANGPTWLGG